MMKRVGFASLSLLGALSLAPSLHAQTPPVDPAAPPAPGAAPAPAAPPAAAPTPAAPTDPAAPAPAAAAAAPAAAPAAAASAGGQARASDGFDVGDGNSNANEEPPAGDNEVEREWRATSLHLGNTLSGSTGVLHVTEAGGGAPGTFRLSLTGSYFAGSGFLCNGTTSCPSFSGEDPHSSDDTTRAGADLGLSATLFPFLEAYAGFHNHATSDSRGRPQLLQVLGDTNLGVKGFTPHGPDSMFSFGGEGELLLLNGTGGVGLDGGSTSFALRALATADLNNRTSVADRIPLRFHANVGYMFDNAGNIVTSVENTKPPQGRGAPISRIERFGLGIDRVDFVQIGFAAEYVNEYVRPFVEWSIDIPLNRQNYTCNVTQAQDNGDLCLGLHQGFSTTPSRFSLGARAFPWKDHGLAVLGAFDIGTGATSSFVQEVAPELPWNFYFGLAYGFDTVAPKPVIQRVTAPPPPAPPPVAQENFIEGIVLEKNTTNAIPDAVIKYDGRPLTGMVSNPDGSFRSASLDPGTYTFNVSATGFHDGQCIGTVQAPLPGPSSVIPAPQAGSVVVQAPAGGPAVPAGVPPTPANGPAPNVVKISCELESLPKVGTVIGSITDPESNQAVDGAHIEVTDKLNRKLELRADSNGAFRFENVPPGPLKFSVDAPGYFTAVAEVNVHAREDAQARILLNKRPAQPNVVVTGKEIKLKKQVHFQHDSAEILTDSEGILEELADLMSKRPDIKGVEVQGHTDNTGTAPYNLRLSQSRAQAVVDAIAKLGIDPSRMTAKGYGQEKPLGPNTTDAGRAKNRRVQVMITEQGK
jgi:outer membrane protein OmpA-like peptidoglycan-associated protein